MSSLWRQTWPARGRAIAVDQIRLAPQLALPLRGLLQQLVPGDRIVMRWVEAAIIDGARDLVVRVGDQPAIPGEAGEDREIALGDAERHIDPGRITPLGDDIADAQQHAVRSTAGTHRPERLVPRRSLAEIARHHLGQIPRPRRLVFGGVASGGGNRGGIQPQFGGCASWPIGGIWRQEVGHRRHSMAYRA